MSNVAILNENPISFMFFSMFWTIAYVCLGCLWCGKYSGGLDFLREEDESCNGIVGRSRYILYMVMYRLAIVHRVVNLLAHRILGWEVFIAFARHPAIDQPSSLSNRNGFDPAVQLRRTAVVDRRAKGLMFKPCCFCNDGRVCWKNFEAWACDTGLSSSVFRIDSVCE